MTHCEVCGGAGSRCICDFQESIFPGWRDRQRLRQIFGVPARPREPPPNPVRTYIVDVTDERVHRYCVDCSAPPDLLRGEGVSLGIDGPIPWGLEPDREIWGYIVGYDSATRRLEVAPKLDESGKFTITTPWIRLK